MHIARLAWHARNGSGPPTTCLSARACTPATAWMPWHGRTGPPIPSHPGTACLACLSCLSLYVVCCVFRNRAWHRGTGSTTASPSRPRRWRQRCTAPRGGAAGNAQALPKGHAKSEGLGARQAGREEKQRWCCAARRHAFGFCPRCRGGWVGGKRCAPSRRHGAGVCMGVLVLSQCSARRWAGRPFGLGRLALSGAQHAHGPGSRIVW